MEKNCSSEENNEEENSLDPETGLLLNPHTETVPFTSQEPGICQMAESLVVHYNSHFPYTPRYDALQVTSKQDYEKNTKDQEIDDLLSEYVHQKFKRGDKSHEREDSDFRIKNVNIRLSFSPRTHEHRSQEMLEVTGNLDRIFKK